MLDLSQIRPTSLDEYQPSCQRKPSLEEIELCQLAFGYRCCTDDILTRSIDLYLLALTGAILFIILSLPSVDNGLSQVIKSFWARLIFKAIVIFIILFLLDRWLIEWRKRNIICTING